MASSAVVMPAEDKASTNQEQQRRLEEIAGMITPSQSGLVNPQTDPETPFFQSPKSLKSFDDGH